MYLLIALLFCSILFPFSAQADCRFESRARFQKAEDAEAWILMRTRKAYTCGVSIDEYGKSAWGCEEDRIVRGKVVKGNGQDCDMLSNLKLSRQYREGKPFTSGEEGMYESWPSGRRYWCDKAFGCRPMR